MTPASSAQTTNFFYDDNGTMVSESENINITPLSISHGQNYLCAVNCLFSFYFALLGRIGL